MFVLFFWVELILGGLTIPYLLSSGIYLLWEKVWWSCSFEKKSLKLCDKNIFNHETSHRKTSSRYFYKKEKHLNYCCFCLRTSSWWALRWVCAWFCCIPLGGSSSSPPYTGVSRGQFCGSGPYRIRIQELFGSESVFPIWIQIHIC